jgi:FkbM family methyltransferase
MKALRNILADIVYQFRISGGLFSRVACVTAYYGVYGFHRLRGLTQDSSRLRALRRVSRMGASRRTVDLVLPDGTAMTMDVLAASFMPREFFFDNMYGLFPQFIPQKGQTVVDVGAHQGMFSTRAAKAVGPTGRVISVEPAATNRALLTGNLSRNGLGNATVFPCAVADFDGETDLFLSPLVTGGSSLFIRAEPERVAEREAVRVPVKRLDRILEEAGASKVDLIKIDAEGACLSILSGAARALAGRPRLVMEVEGGDDDVRRVVDKLESSGYRCVRRDSVVYAEPAEIARA